MGPPLVNKSGGKPTNFVEAERKMGQWRRAMRVERVKREKSRIEKDNGRMMDAILRARPAIPVTSDRRSADK